MSPGTSGSEFIRWFSDLTLDDIPSVGGKNASLGEMVRELRGVGVQVPDGFAITAEAYRRFLAQEGLDDRIRQMLDGLNTQDVEDLRLSSRPGAPSDRGDTAAGHFAICDPRGLCPSG